MHFKKSYCKDCDDNVKAEAKGANHVLHFLLSCITLSAWVVIWILCAYSKNFTCSECGGRRLGRPKSKAKLARAQAKLGLAA
jgi:hypothetical protein